MKPATSSVSTVRNTARVVRAPKRPSPYVSAAQTKSLLASSLAARNERLQAADMVNTDDAASIAATTRVTINAWISKGRAIGLTQTRRGFRLPVWQFDPQFWELIPKLSKALGTTEGWTLLSFLETPLGCLDGKTPRAAIEQGLTERVLDLAAAEGT